MIRTTHRPALFVAGLLVMPLAHGAGWTGKGELGALLARGNADATSADAKLDVAETTDNWKNALHLAFLLNNVVKLREKLRTRERVLKHQHRTVSHFHF